MNGDQPDLLYTPGELRIPVEQVCSLASASGNIPLPAEPSDIIEYLEERSAEGARPSTMKVIAAAIGRRHEQLGSDKPL